MLLKLYFSENKFMWLYQRRWFIVCIFFAIALFSSHLCAKTSSYKIDSFKQAIKNATTDTEKVNDLISL